MSGNWPKEPYRPNPDAPYQAGDVIELAIGNVPPRWEVLCAGKYTYFVRSLDAPRWRQTESTWVTWSCHQSTKLVQRGT